MMSSPAVLFIAALCVVQTVGFFRPAFRATVTQDDINSIRNAMRDARGNGMHGDYRCLREQLYTRTRITIQGYQLDHNSFVMCTLNVVPGRRDGQLQLYAPNTPTPSPNIQTMFLHLYGLRTASFIALPRTSRPTFFITDALTGCDVFVAVARGAICPLIVIHTNWVEDREDDVNLALAEAVLTDNNLCGAAHYQIQYRLASVYHREVVQPSTFLTHYYENVEKSPHIFYGYTYGEKWEFCRKPTYSIGIVDCYTDPLF